MKRNKKILPKKPIALLAGLLIGFCLIATRGNGAGTPFSSTPLNKGQNEAAPIPDIKGNGQDGPITISTSDNLNVTISLDAGGSTAKVDWWMIQENPGSQWQYYNLGTQNFQNTSLSALEVTYQANLFNLGNYSVFNFAFPLKGTYKFYFGIDGNPDGKVTPTLLFYDTLGKGVKSTLDRNRGYRIWVK